MLPYNFEGARNYLRFSFWPTASQWFSIEKEICYKVFKQALKSVLDKCLWYRHTLPGIAYFDAFSDGYLVGEFNPRLTGGGAVFPPPSFFRDISQSYKRIITKFLIPSKTSIWHILTKKNRYLRYIDHKWRQSDVMFSRFQPEIRVCGKRCDANDWRDRTK